MPEVALDMASALVRAGDGHSADQLAALAPVPRDAPVIVAGSPLADGALFRIAGFDIEAVVHATRDRLRAACTQLGEDPWSRKW